MMLSVVSPIYFSQDSVELLVEKIKEECDKLEIQYEIILVDDGSLDDSWYKIEALSKIHSNVIGIKLSRNFGQHYAISCGIEHAIGEWIVVMDGDLQDHPKEIVRLYEKTKVGYKIVTANRINRKDTFFKKSTSILFWKCLSYLSGTKLHHTISNFGIYHQSAIQAVVHMRDTIRFFPTMIHAVGFPKTTIDVEHNARQEGKSTYSLKRMLRLALDVIIVNSEKPLKLVVKAGLLISLVSFMVAVYYSYRYLTNQIVVPGYTSIILSIWFLGGNIILILGILGLYVSKTLDAVKSRPYYIIEKKTNK